MASAAHLLILFPPSSPQPKKADRIYTIVRWIERGPRCWESLLTLAAQAGWTVVAAATTDAWDTARREFAQLLGHGDAKQIRLTEQRLDETREQLIGTAKGNTEETRTALAERWTGRLADLLEEQPNAEADLRMLVKETQARLPARSVSAPDYAVTVWRDVNVRSARGENASAATYWSAEAGDDRTVAVPRQMALHSVRPDILAAEISLASWIGQAGNAAAARDQFAALVPVCERVLGPEHPDALAVRGELAYWTGQAGNAAAARDQFAALVPVCERVLGPEHPDALAVRGELAYWTGAGGERGRRAGSVRRAGAGV